jgi:ABC-type polysaccharide/polyol phosphate export permease
MSNALATPQEAPDSGIAGAGVPELLIDADHRRPLRACLAELYHNRGVLTAFVKRYIKIKYKQTALGVAWAVLQPLIATAILAVVLGRFAHLSSERLPYVPFAMAGAIIWTFFAGSVLFSMDSVIREQGFLRKVYFAREILPISSVLAFLFDLVPAAAMFLIIATVTGSRFSWTVVLLPLPIALAVVFATALGMAVSALTAYFRDMRLIMPFVIQVGILATPVAYSFGLVPAQWRGLYAAVNPVGIAIDTVRRVALHAQAPDWGIFLLSSAAALIELAVAYWLYKRVDAGFVDTV